MTKERINDIQYLEKNITRFNEFQVTFIEYISDKGNDYVLSAEQEKLIEELVDAV